MAREKIPKKMGYPITGSQIPGPDKPNQTTLVDIHLIISFILHFKHKTLFVIDWLSTSSIAALLPSWTLLIRITRKILSNIVVVPLKASIIMTIGRRNNSLV